MRDTLTFIIIAGVFCLFSGCHSEPETPQESLTEEKSDSQAASELSLQDYPDWVLSTPREEGYYFGIGGGDNLAEAKQKALVNTGQQFCVTVKSALFEQDRIQGDRMDRVFTSVDEQLTDHLLRGVKFYDQYEDDKGFCWVLARAPLECSP